jgi:hypothetical protein
LIHQEGQIMTGLEKMVSQILEEADASAASRYDQ